MAALEFFFDPICPWAWLTSRWIDEVRTLRDLDVRWRFIALRFVNDGRDYGADFPPAYAHLHGVGLSMLRVAAGVAELEANDAVGRLCTGLGTELHNRGVVGEVFAGAGTGAGDVAVAALDDVGLDSSFAALVDDDRFDERLWADTWEALARLEGFAELKRSARGDFVFPD